MIDFLQHSEGKINNKGKQRGGEIGLAIIASYGPAVKEKGEAGYRFVYVGSQFLYNKTE